jgi:hypothetical protein
MAVLSDRDIARLLFATGFNFGLTFPIPDDAIEKAPVVLGVAIVLAESGGDPKITGKADKDDRGLWQINRRWHPEVSDVCAYDAACSTKEAYRISKQGTDYSEWNTYKYNDYKRYMDRAKEAAKYVFGEEIEVENPPIDWGDVAEEIPGVKALASVGDLIAWLTTPANLVKVLKVVIGIALVLIGLSIFARSFVTENLDKIPLPIPGKK